MKKKEFNSQLYSRIAGLMVYDIASVLAASFLAIVMRYEFDIDLIPYYFQETIKLLKNIDLKNLLKRL